MTPVIIIGAGGFGLEVAAYCEDAAAAGAGGLIKGFVDDTKPAGAFHAGYPLLGPASQPLDPDAHYLIAIGWPEHRRAVAESFKARGARFARLVHPLAYVAKSAILGAGCIIAPFAFIGPAARLGDQVLVNVQAVVGHEAVIGDYAVLSPHVDIHGAARLESDVFVGGGGQAARGVRIGARSRLAAGAVAYGDIPPDSLALGNPARFGALEAKLPGQ